VEEIVTVYDLPKKGTENYQRKRAILTFYSDELVAACVGDDQFPLKIRKYHTMVDTRMIDQKEKPRVSAKGEAMLRVIYTNCHFRWELMAPEVAKDSDWKIPQYNKEDEETHNWWKTKWSDMHSGKVEGAGWKPGAYTAFNQHLKAILDFRKMDSKRGFQMYKYCKKLVRERHNVTEKTAAGKRKRNGKAAKEGELRPWWIVYSVPVSKVNLSYNSLCMSIPQFWCLRTLRKRRKTGVSTVRPPLVKPVQT
jgi:hypothetical protein